MTDTFLKGDRTNAGIITGTVGLLRGERLYTVAGIGPEEAVYPSSALHHKYFAGDAVMIRSTARHTTVAEWRGGLILTGNGEIHTPGEILPLRPTGTTK